MHWFTLAFLVALTAHVAVRLWLARRQVDYVNAHRDRVPQGFAASVTVEEHARAADYTAVRQRCGMLETIADAVILLWLTLGGGIAWTAGIAAATSDSTLVAGTLHVLGVFALLAVLALPFGAYRTFVVEKRFGFNRTRPAVFVADRLKGWALGLVLGGSAAAGVLWIMEEAGRLWWLVGWGAWIMFSLLVTWAWPRVIAPVFNTFTPLQDPELRARIDALVERCGFRAKSVFVMDGSRRSSHGNAYFTGLGREKRIVFFDTLLASLTPAQVESVLAHELAHFRLRHVPQRLALGAAMSLAGFALLGWLGQQAWFYSALGVPERSDAAALLLFLLVSPVITWVVAPIVAGWSRRHEYQADAFAARHSDARALADALVRMYRDNASTLTPDPLYSAFHDSHPPPAARIARLASMSAPGSATAAAP
jgi:STE24 endopeptidase